MSRRRRTLKVVVPLTVLAVAAGCAEERIGAGDGGGSGSDYPPGNVDLVVAGDPGGGLDILGRQVQHALREAELADTTLNIQNLGGGSGNPAMAVAAQRPDDEDVLVVNSNRVYLNPITGNSDLTLGEDFVAISQLMTEYVVLAVREDSAYESATEVMDALADDPQALALGVGTVPSDDQLHLLRAAEEAGADAAELNIVAFSAGGDLMTQLLGGHVDVISSGLSEVLPQYESGDVRILAISAPERVEGAGSDIPTWTEQGYDVVLEHWRGVFGPAGMPQAARDYWSDTFRQMTESDTWSEILAANGWVDMFRDGEEFTELLAEEADTAHRLLADAGLVDG